MAIDIEDYLTRMGTLFGYANSVAAITDPLTGSQMTTIVGLLDGTNYRTSASSLIDLISTRTGLSNSVGLSAYTAIHAAASSLTIETARLEGGRHDGTLTTALRQVVTDMGASTLQAVGTNSVTGSITAGNQGNGALITNGYRPGSTTTLRQSLMTETIKAECSVPGTVANYGAATFRFSGTLGLNRTDTFWPGGSGASIDIAATSPNITATGNAPGVSILANGDFETWSGDTPVGWTAVVGTAGTHFRKGTTYARGAYALELVGNGSTLTRLRQQIAYASGAPTSVQPETTYAIVFSARVSAATTGTVAVALRDSAGATVGTAITMNLATLTTSYAVKSVSFSVARGALPTTLFLDIYSTTAIASSGVLMVDEMVFAPMTQLYRGGPSALVYPGSTDWSAQDKMQIAVVSDFSAEGVFIKAFERWFMNELNGIYFPVTTGIPTYDDALCSI